MLRTFRLAALSLCVLLIAAACSAASTPAPSAGGSVPASTTKAPGPAATPGSSVAGPATSSQPVGSPVATVPDAQLILAGNLFICSDLPYPPQEYFDDQGVPIGSDVEIGQAIAGRLSLIPHIENTIFDTIVPALLGGKCDIIISAQNITSQRIKQVSMIPFFQAGQSFVVAKGNPAGIKTQDDLCGKTIAAESSTTEVDYLNGTPKSDFEGKGLTQACTAKGKSAITVKTFTKDNDALLALQTAKVDAYFADSPVAGFYTVQSPDKFELSGLTLGVALEGISVARDAGHKDLLTAVQQALVSMITDGTYLKILTKFGDEPGAVTADVAGTINKLK
jgi:polar amino acid transport system substrate-binding protein